MTWGETLRWTHYEGIEFNFQMLTVCVKVMESGG